MREAAGWAVSTVIVLAILIAVGISVYGPKNLDWGIKQNLVSTLKINRGSGGMTIEEASAVIDPAATTQATRTPANSVR